MSLIELKIGLMILKRKIFVDLSFGHTPRPSQEGTIRLFILRYLLKSQIRVKDIEFEIDKIPS